MPPSSFKSAAMISRALRLRYRTTISPTINYLHSRTNLSSSSTAAAAYHGNLSNSGDGTCGGSAVYRDARKFARPCTVTWAERLHNFVSFIGIVQYPLRQFATKTGSFGVYTVLRVKTSPDSHNSFRILLEMWNEMAHRAFQHLKPDDYIYVSGHLGAYTKSALEGIEKIRYKVTAKELNYVNQGESEAKVGVAEKGESGMQKSRNQLHLWQVFFVNPSEWYDQRRTKKSPRSPDFKHKSTGEALWLKANDPPWIKKQLELLDSRLSLGPGLTDSRPLASRWVSDELLVMPNTHTEHEINGDELLVMPNTHTEHEINGE